MIWDKRREFDQYLKEWSSDSLHLPIEFCRKSSSRHNALTLVIDQQLETHVETLFAFSKRLDPRDVRRDLCDREETTIGNIGFVNLENGEWCSRNRSCIKTIKTWAVSKNVQFVVWTDLESGFSEQTVNEFVQAAKNHLRCLTEVGIQETVKYIVKAPQQTNTYLRKILMEDEWFKKQLVLYE